MKVVFVGESKVGKTCLVKRLTTGLFDEDHSVSTLGAAYSTYEVYSEKKKQKIQMNIWDTAGQEKFRALVKNYYTEAKVSCFVYDISDLNSFKQLDYWIHEFAELQPDSFKVLLGNKIDLFAESEVSPEDAEAFAREHNFKIFKEVSAKEGVGLTEVFQKIVDDYEPVTLFPARKVQKLKEEKKEKSVQRQTKKCC